MNENIFEKVKEVARIEEVVEHVGVRLDRHGKALCPFHKEKTPSFSIKKDDNIFKCFGCGAAGDAIDFVAKYKGIEALEAAKVIAEMYGINDKQKGEKQQARLPISKVIKAQKIASVAAKQSIKEYIKACIKDVGKTDYFVKRGLTKDTIAKFGLGYDIKKQCVVIPYSSEHTYYQTRSTDGKEFRKPPTEIAGVEPLWNAKALSGIGTVFIVESPICAMSIMQCGEAAVATCGTSGINKIVKAIKAKKPRCTFILCMDNDEPGQDAQQNLANQLFELNIKYIPVNIAGECKDPNELLIKDPKQLEKNIKTAVVEARKRYATDKDSFDACDLVNETLEPVVWIVEDLLPTGLAMLCAPSKYGKSWMVLQLCIAAAEGNSFLNFKTVQCGSLYYALEDGKWSCATYVMMGRKYCKGYNIREEDLKEHFLSAYNEAAAYEPHEVQDLGASIRDLLSQERELIALRAKKYLNKEAYEEQHEELLQQLKEYETEYATESRRLGDGKAHKAAYCYSDRLVRSLEVAEINGYKITFKFKNGAAISRIFNNETNRKETWARKAGGM